MKISITYDNEARFGFKSGWGFSSLIETGNKKILFDTGCEGPSLIYNMRKLGYKPEDIDIIVLSHEHWDHVGGLFDVLKENSDVKVFVLKSFSEGFKNRVRQIAELVDVEKQREIMENVYTTGIIKNNPDEQSLILKTQKGIVVIVGCSHPGVDRILELAKNYGRIYGIIGGFHGFSRFDALAGIELIGACHCTQYKKEIKERFPDKFKELKAGDTLEII